MKKVLAVIISLLFVAALSFAVVGCKKAEEQKPAPAAAPAPAPGACSRASPRLLRQHRQPSKKSFNRHEEGTGRTAMFGRFFYAGFGKSPDAALKPRRSSSCRSGACGFCRSRLLSGEIFVRPEDDGRRAADRTFGFFHACASYPRSDLVIEVPRDV